MAEKFLEKSSGRTQENEALTSSAGGADAGKIIGLDGAGRISQTMMPVGIGPDIKNMVTSENLSAGDYVNIYDNAGTITARLADNSNDRPAHGFVKAATISPAAADVFFEGANSDLSGLTLGVRHYLGTVGQPTSTPPSGAGVLCQFLGISISATEINTDIEDEVVLA